MTMLYRPHERLRCGEAFCSLETAVRRMAESCGTSAERAFSLVELLVVITIIGVLIRVVVAGGAGGAGSGPAMACANISSKSGSPCTITPPARRIAARGHLASYPDPRHRTMIPWPEATSTTSGNTAQVGCCRFFRSWNRRALYRSVGLYEKCGRQSSLGGHRYQPLSTAPRVALAFA